MYEYSSLIIIKINKNKIMYKISIVTKLAIHLFIFI